MQAMLKWCHHYLTILVVGIYLDFEGDLIALDRAGPDRLNRSGFYLLAFVR